MPGLIGREIADKWKERPGVANNPNALFAIGHRIQHVIKILKEKCTDIQISRLLKDNDYGFCKKLYLPQTYGADKRDYKRLKSRKKYKDKRYIPRKKYFLRKSNRKKPYLDPNKHVRKFKPTRLYKNKLECFTCGSPEHLSRTCPKRINRHDRNSTLIECTNEDLINIDETVSDTEAIYSIVSIDDKIEGNIESEPETSKLIEDFVKMEIPEIDLSDLEDYDFFLIYNKNVITNGRQI